MASRVQYQQDGSCLPAVNFHCLGGRSEGDGQMLNLSLQNRNKKREKLKETEFVLASEMSKMTIQERTKAMDDLHCVGDDLKETPEMIEQSLDMFDKELQQRGSDSFYDMAAKQNRAYVEDRSFRLRFIRANFHDISKAVSQMFHFLRIKAKHFGIESIGRDITLNDFNEDDREALMSGAYHIQAERDKNGRMIVYGLSVQMGRCTSESLCRVAYFVYFNVLSAMPEVQMKGLVLILYDTSKLHETGEMDVRSSPLHVMGTIKSLPIRFSARHLCVKQRDGMLNPLDRFMKIVCKLSGAYSRARTKVHYGSDLELQYSLRGHGISSLSCPVNSDGEVREDILKVWLNDYLKTKESPSNSSHLVTQPSASFVGSSNRFSLHGQDLDFETQNHSLYHDSEALLGNYDLSSGVNATLSPAAAKMEDQGRDDGMALSITPTEIDVLLGRGRPVQNNPGNIRFRQFVEKRQNEYDYASRGRRGEIMAEMRKTLASRGVRFLKKVQKDVWVESNSKEVDTKIAQLFREFRKQKK